VGLCSDQGQTPTGRLGGVQIHIVERRRYCRAFSLFLKRLDPPADEMQCNSADYERDDGAREPHLERHGKIDDVES
jgi:hypothetical protein